MRFNEEKELTDREFQILQSKLADYNRSHTTAYLLWLFLGGFGLHQFYIGKSKTGLLYIGLLATAGISLLIAALDPVQYAPLLLIWIVPMGILAIFLLYDLFTIPSQIKGLKDKKREHLIKEIKSQ